MSCRTALAALATITALVSGCMKTPARREFVDIRPRPPLAEAVAVRLRVLNADREVPHNGALVVEVQLVNRSRTDAFVYNELELGWLVVLEMLGPEGRYVRTPLPDWARRGRGGRHHYVALPPGGFVGRRYALRCTDPRWKMPPGFYRLRAVYRNGVRACAATPQLTEEDVTALGERAFVPVLTGMVVSEVETFVVR
jgi:hypothetical protein